jgi:hypothetical protein
MASKQSPKPPSKEVQEKQEAEYSESDFDHDLEKATRQLEDASPPAKRESRT